MLPCYPVSYSMAMDLSKKKCIPCEGGIDPLNESQITEYANYISAGWQVLENTRLSREFYFVNYRHTIDFVNKVANIAEEEGHHPVLHVFFGRIVVELWTHAINGLSENDFILAAKIDKI
jgi:4a-hydroxytetrahydrobiopterin dehydratase